jgi:hypothetical protein
MFGAIERLVLFNIFVAPDVEIGAMFPFFPDMPATHGSGPGVAQSILLFKKFNEMLANLFGNGILIYFDKITHSIDDSWSILRVVLPF